MPPPNDDWRPDVARQAEAFVDWMRGKRCVVSVKHCDTGSVYVRSEWAVVRFSDHPARASEQAAIWYDCWARTDEGLEQQREQLQRRFRPEIKRLHLAALRSALDDELGHHGSAHAMAIHGLVHGDGLGIEI